MGNKSYYRDRKYNKRWQDRCRKNYPYWKIKIIIIKTKTIIITTKTTTPRPPTIVKMNSLSNTRMNAYYVWRDSIPLRILVFQPCAVAAKIKRIFIYNVCINGWNNAVIKIAQFVGKN